MLGFVCTALAVIAHAEGEPNDETYSTQEIQSYGPNVVLSSETPTPEPEPSIIYPTSTPSPIPTATPEPTPIPAATPRPVVLQPVPKNIGAVGDIVAQFNQGWLDAGGSEAMLPRIFTIIMCESTWNPYAVNGKYIGLGQWDSTWWSYGGGDIHSPYQQGYNMATRFRIDGSLGAWSCA